MFERRAVVPLQSRTRLLSAAIIAVLAGSGLVACTGQDGSLAQWLESQDIVESVDVSPTPGGSTNEADVRGVVKESATSGEIRQLALDTVAYTDEHNSRDNVSLRVAQHGPSLKVEYRLEDVNLAFDHWETIRKDPRVTGGLVQVRDISLQGARSDLVGLAVDFGDVSRTLVVISGEQGSPVIELTPCGLDGGGAAFASAIIEDAAIDSARISLCSEVLLATASPDDMIGLASRVRQLSEQSDNHDVDIHVVYDVEDDFLFEGYPEWDIPISRFDEQAERLLTRVFDAPSTSTARLDSEGQLHIGVDSLKVLRKAATSVFADPDLAAASSVRLREGGFEGGAKPVGTLLIASTLDEAELALHLLEQLRLHGDISYASVTPSWVSVNMADDAFTLENGRAVIDVIVASGLSTRPSVSINPSSGKAGLQIKAGVRQPTDDVVGSELGKYWQETVLVP